MGKSGVALATPNQRIANEEQMNKLENRPLRIAILGASGSVGRQCVQVAGDNPQRVQVVALAARSNREVVGHWARELAVSHVALAEKVAPPDLPPGCELAFGAQALADLARLAEVDLVLNAIVGAAGLAPSYAALQAGKTLALANKE